MCGACSEIEGARIDEDVARKISSLYHSKFREAEIVTDCDANVAVKLRGFEGGWGVSGCENVAFSKGYCIGNVDIEKMGLAMFGN